MLPFLFLLCAYSTYSCVRAHHMAGAIIIMACMVAPWDVFYTQCSLEDAEQQQNFENTTTTTTTTTATTNNIDNEKGIVQPAVQYMPGDEDILPRALLCGNDPLVWTYLHRIFYQVQYLDPDKVRPSTSHLPARVTYLLYDQPG